MKRLSLIFNFLLIVSLTIKMYGYDFNDFRKDVKKNYEQIVSWSTDLYNKYAPKNENDVVELLDATYNAGEQAAKKISKVIEKHGDKVVERLDTVLGYDPNHDFYEFDNETIAGKGHTFLVQRDAKTGKLVAICHDDWGCPCINHNTAELREFMEEYVETMRECGLLDSRFSWNNKPYLANDKDWDHDLY